MDANRLPVHVIVCSLEQNEISQWDGTQGKRRTWSFSGTQIDVINCVPKVRVHVPLRRHVGETVPCEFVMKIKTEAGIKSDKVISLWVLRTRI